MIPDAGNELDFVGQLDQVIVGAQGEGLALDLGVFVGGKDDDGDVLGARVGAVLADQGQAVDARA